jgi:isopenicillin N synthase-like dioxygenase
LYSKSLPTPLYSYIYPHPGQINTTQNIRDSQLFTITIVFIDDNVSGLQLQNNGAWYNVPIVPNALLVNVGDVIEVHECKKFTV